MGRAIDQDNRLDDHERRLKLVEDALEEDGVSALEAKIDARILEQITPTSVTKTIA